MQLERVFSRGRPIGRQAGWQFWAAIAGGMAAIAPAQAAFNVVLWDTGSPLAGDVDVQSRAGWEAVPSELFCQEADPAKAASDPGYYGREYSFRGDAVVENRALAAVFGSAGGRVVIYAKKGDSLPLGSGAQNAGLGRKIVDLLPRQSTGQSARISRCGVLRHAADEVALEIVFSAKDTPDAAAVFVFDRTGIVEIRPAEGLNGVSLLGPIEYGMVPSFIGDDLIYAPGEYPSARALSVPAENVFLGLLSGEDAEWVMTWPPGTQQLQLRLGQESARPRLIESIEFDSAGQSFYLAGLSAPGIWHKETLTRSYLEKEVRSPWQRPFPAKWKTQLEEAGLKTTFAFRDAPGQIWRGVPGSYAYPVWFDGENACYHLGKKVPPKGDSLVYFLEPENTPLSVATPVDIMRATLGRSVCDRILDLAGRKLRTHHRRGGEGVHRACTCGCTEAIQALFEAGQEVTRQKEVQGAVEDMMFFVRRHVERIGEYRHFADELINFLQATERSTPGLKPFLDGLEQIAQQIPEEYSVQKENMQSLAYADDLARRTIALTGQPDPNNLKSYMELSKAWRAMGGAQDYVLARYHTLTRKLAQEAGYGCVDQPQAAAAALAIRARCRQCLRNPDGYEIWAEY